jgi:hypothetical protein
MNGFSAVNGFSARGLHRLMRAAVTVAIVMAISALILAGVV